MQRSTPSTTFSSRRLGTRVCCGDALFATFPPPFEACLSYPLAPDSREGRSAMLTVLLLVGSVSNTLDVYDPTSSDKRRVSACASRLPFTFKRLESLPLSESVARRACSNVHVSSRRVLMSRVLSVYFAVSSAVVLSGLFLFFFFRELVLVLESVSCASEP